MLKGIKVGDTISLATYKNAGENGGGDNGGFGICPNATVWQVSQEDGILMTNYGEFVVSNILQGLEGSDGHIYKLFHTEKEMDRWVKDLYIKSIEDVNALYRAKMDEYDGYMQKNLDLILREETEFLDKWGRESDGKTSEWVKVNHEQK